MTDLFDFKPKKRLYAVFGNPISHSKSPLVHRLFAKQFGINLEYRAVQIDVGGFEQAVSAFQAGGGRGINVTIPFKFNAYRLVDRLSERAGTAGAVNTIIFDEVMSGDNTDGIGLVTDIETNCGVKIEGRNILIVGAGGATRGILGPMLDRNPLATTVANRTKDKAMQLAVEFSRFGEISGCGLDEVSGRSHDIVINATSTELTGALPAVSPRIFENAELAYDLMYGAERTLFMKWGRGNGARMISDGLGMLVEQAAESFLIWHGQKPETGSVIETVRQKLR